MNFEDFAKEAQAGDIVWICDYRFNDLDNKPIRHVKPTRVAVMSNEDLPKGKRVYYADIHFRPLGKNDALKAQVIAPYDNTGFRAYTGVALQVFRDESECKAHYNMQCRKIIASYESEKVAKISYYDSMIQQIRDKMVA